MTHFFDNKFMGIDTLVDKLEHHLQRMLYQRASGSGLQTIPFLFCQ